MKRTHFFILCCIFFNFISCNDKEDDNLIGTNWVGYYDWGTKFMFSFNNNSKCIETYYSENPVQYEHTYKYSGKNIEIFAAHNDDKLYATGKISGNKLILIFDVLEEQQYIYELVRE